MKVLLVFALLVVAYVMIRRYAESKGARPPTLSGAGGLVQRTWCANCNQFVSPQRDRSNNGYAAGVLFLFTLVLFAAGAWIIGVVVLVGTVLFVLLALVFEVAKPSSPARCPICKDTNLILSGKPVDTPPPLPPPTTLRK